MKHLLFSSDQNRIMLGKRRAGARPEFSHVAVVLESLMKKYEGIELFYVKVLEK